MMVMFFGVIGLLYVWMRVDLLRIGRHIENLKQQEILLEHRQETLQLQLSQLTAPQKIAAAARLQFDLEMPEPGQIVMVASETAVATKGKRRHKAVELAQHQIVEEYDETE